MSGTELQVNRPYSLTSNKSKVKLEKLKYYLEQMNELIEDDDLRETETVNKRTKAILDEIYNLVSTAQEMKVEQVKIHRKRFITGRKM